MASLQAFYSLCLNDEMLGGLSRVNFAWLQSEPFVDILVHVELRMISTPCFLYFQRSDFGSRLWVADHGRVARGGIIVRGRNEAQDEYNQRLPPGRTFCHHSRVGRKVDEADLRSSAGALCGAGSKRCCYRGRVSRMLRT